MLVTTEVLELTMQIDIIVLNDDNYDVINSYNYAYYFNYS
jgi:hypothetical protein